MTNKPVANLSVQQLQRALPIKQQIEALEQELAQILAAKPAITAPLQSKKKRTLSAATKAKIATAQTARWAKRKKPVVAIEPPAKVKRKMSSEGRARNIAATKARWVKFRAAKKRAKGV